MLAPLPFFAEFTFQLAMGHAVITVELFIRDCMSRMLNMTIHNKIYMVIKHESAVEILNCFIDIDAHQFFCWASIHCSNSLVFPECQANSKKDVDPWTVASSFHTRSRKSCVLSIISLPSLCWLCHWLHSKNCHKREITEFLMGV